jgi:hypothetical protein
MDWDRKFDEPIPLPNGKKLTTLREAALYITKLPKAEHDADEWQAAMEALMLVADLGGPTMFARIGIMRALNRSRPIRGAEPEARQDSQDRPMSEARTSCSTRSAAWSRMLRARRAFLLMIDRLVDFPTDRGICSLAPGTECPSVPRDSPGLASGPPKGLPLCEPPPVGAPGAGAGAFRGLSGLCRHGRAVPNR